VGPRELSAFKELAVSHRWGAVQDSILAFRARSPASTSTPISAKRPRSALSIATRSPGRSSRAAAHQLGLVLDAADRREAHARLPRRLARSAAAPTPRTSKNILGDIEADDRDRRQIHDRLADGRLLKAIAEQSSGLRWVHDNDRHGASTPLGAPSPRHRKAAWLLNGGARSSNLNPAWGIPRNRKNLTADQ
jgi:hypothetical protein